MFDPRLLVGYDSSDDACVYSVSDDVAVIETVDFFTPIVDDPYLFGQIAAANALSDVYAMGGVPKLAMNLLCVPSCLPLDTVRAILEGGHDKAVEAGCVIAGGHTIQDDEPKYGLCVTGFVHPQHILKNIGAQPGDVLVLTKALGVGVITTALKAALADDSARDAAYASMAALNAKAAQAVREVENVHACTDVTGFGLLGHSYEMASGSGVTVRLHGAALPLLPQAAEQPKDLHKFLRRSLNPMPTRISDPCRKELCRPRVPRCCLPPQKRAKTSVLHKIPDSWADDSWEQCLKPGCFAGKRRS